MEAINQKIFASGQIPQVITADSGETETDLEVIIRLKTNTLSQNQYELLRFSGITSLSIESVITSCVSIDKSLLLINNSSRGHFLKQLAAINKVHFYELYSQDKQIPLLNRVIDMVNANKSVTHIVLPLLSIVENEHDLIALFSVVESLGISLIVDYYGKLDAFSFDLKQFPVSCMVISPMMATPRTVPYTFVLARRRFLSVCIGNARSYSLDLYSAWQNKMWKPAM